jgi:integrase
VEEVLSNLIPEGFLTLPQECCGLRMTAHQFRHAAAAIFLKEHPGEYETIWQLLGHRNIQTTMNFYVGLNTIQANELFNELIKKRLHRELEPAE